MENINKEEMQAAQQEADDASTAYVHTFKKPFEFEGKIYETLTFQWDSLTGNDSLAIEAEIAAIGKTLIAPEISGEYQIRMASRACTESLGYDAIMAMPIRDFNKIRNKARSFLLNTAL